MKRSGLVVATRRSPGSMETAIKYEKLNKTVVMKELKVRMSRGAPLRKPRRPSIEDTREDEGKPKT